MRWRLIVVLTAAVLVAGACNQSSATGQTSPLTGSSVSSKTPSGTPGASGHVAPSATPSTVDLTGTTYKALPAKVKGGKVTLAEWQFPDMVNPYYAISAVDWTDVVVADSMFDGLLKITPDLKYAPDLAMNVPTLENHGVALNGDGMDVTWRLRPGMKWSDGQPINCDDIKATWAWMVNKDQPNGVLAAGTIGWQDVTGVDGGVGTDCVLHFG